MALPETEIVLTIAGSDPSGGAGVQADLKTIAAHGCYGCAVITALTAQNTRGVAAVHVPPAEFLERQIELVLSDFPPKAIKIGMLPGADAVRVVARALRPFDVPVVLDPVMVATSGASLSTREAVRAVMEELFPLAALVTPNIPEAEALAGLAIANEEDMLRAAGEIARNADAVLIKGGHLAGGADDLLWRQGETHWFRGERIPGGSAHGTGCTLSSAIACRLAQGHDMPGAVRLSKAWLTDLLRAKPEFGVPNGPLLHRGI